MTATVIAAADADGTEPPAQSALFRILHEFGYWIRRYRRSWRGTIVISVANPLLFVLAMGAGLGRLVNQSHAAALHGVPYLQFMAPGLLAAAAMQTAVIEAGGPVLQSARNRGNYRTAFATPMRATDIMTGHLLFMALRLTASTLAITAVVTAFGAVPPARAALLVPAALLTGLAFAAPLAAYAVTVQRPARLGAIYRFVIMPLYMFSGTFYPTTQLPAWLRDVVLVSPLWHGVELCRGIALGDATPAATAVHVAILSALAVCGYFAARHTYQRVLNA
ncbi:MAG TPA: ABC transporter permease [Trebonia sp.]|jgi:lipooligosaccharide transport system permease protein|nr:ABC transporter permease [Trebonia sp.]